MFQKVDFVQKAKLSTNSTTIKFGENLGFDVCYEDSQFGPDFCIKHIKGDFEITKMTTFCKNSAQEYDIYYSKLYNSFSRFGFGNGIYKFYITANIEMKEICVETRAICISDIRLQLLKLYQYFKGEIDLDGFKLIYYVKKIKENGSTGNNIEIYIENPYDMEIEGKKGDYKIEQCGTKSINLVLTFVYDPSIIAKICEPEEIVETENKANIEQNESTQIAASDQSRPESVIPSESTKPSKWFKIMSNQKCADFFFILPDKIKIPSHRCILYESSTIFAKFVDESSELPILINIKEDFDAETIKAALEFLYDKYDSINGKEMDVFKFAVKYCIHDLTDACCSFFEKSVDPTNVCEFIQIAYNQNFEELKQKCLKLLIEKKKEVDAAELSNLPKNILFDFFNSF
uniref:BTB domain-containing protein n=1 Tax=Panagrolaimus sp. ES5 TaxID=591445 RepID=A0AC34FFA2_9BILA